MTFFNSRKFNQKPVGLSWQVGAWLAALWFCWLGLQGFVAEWPPDLALIEAGWLLLAPIAWKLSQLFDPGALSNDDARGEPGDVKQGRLGDVCLSLLIAVVALAMCIRTGLPFDGLPPAYHDEYSYLFQAESMLTGRWSWPSAAAFPELFDQYHVLNEGRMGSRYYPGTGFWLLPWLWLGHPYWGQYGATAFSAVLLYWIGRELDGRATGFIAGISLAMSSGVSLFANLLLAHQATLACLMVFLLGFARGLRTHRFQDFFLSGIGLGWALLCRPATAAGVGLPFGIWCFLRIASDVRLYVRSYRADSSQSPVGREQGALRTRIFAVLAGYAFPLMTALTIAGFYNLEITGDWRTSPYQLYTDIYTPRHVYGLNNGVRGDQRQGPKVLKAYDRWAENLTPELANQNTLNRWIISGLWTVGLPLLATATVLSLPLLWGPHRGWQCIAWATVTLHGIHWPYWYTGIMGWHYVFETAPLWCLLLGHASVRLISTWRQAGHGLMCYWFPVLWLFAWGGQYLPMNEETPSRWWKGVQSIVFPRAEHAKFQELVTSQTHGQRALVLIDQTASNPHLDLVINSPGLASRVLLGRFDPQVDDAVAIAEAYPDRAVFIAQPERKRIIPVDQWLGERQLP